MTIRHRSGTIVGTFECLRTSRIRVVIRIVRTEMRPDGVSERTELSLPCHVDKPGAGCYNRVNGQLPSHYGGWNASGQWGAWRV